MSQVNYFALPSDDAQFFAALSARPDTAILSDRCFTSATPIRIDSLPEHHTSELTIAHAALLPFYPPVSVQDGPYQGSYHFDLFRSAVIAWSRSTVTGNTLVSGRIFAKIGWLESTDHNRLYRSWYGSIERWLKRHMKRVDEVWWIAPEAERWSLSGGVLAFGPGNSMRRGLAESRNT